VDTEMKSARAEIRGLKAASNKSGSLEEEKLKK
jgi:hypothetical protein